MRRRLSIAMAIIHKPTLLFLDEPTPGLDAQSARAIRTLIRRLNAEGTTVFLTTHQIEEANQLCDRVAIINHGQIAAVDTPEQLKLAFQRVQSVEVALDPDGGMYRESLAALPGVTTQIKTGDKWRLYTDDPSALLPQVVDYARSRGLRVVSLNTLGPSLEDAFLLERRIGTYDRLLAAPMSLVSLLLGKTLVGAVFAIAVSVVPLLVGLLGLQVSLANAGMLLVGIVLASLVFSAFGLVFASIPTRSVGNIMMPSTLVRWPLMFISGVFIPLGEMAPWARTLAYISPLTCAQDLMNYAVLGVGLLGPRLDLIVLLVSGGLFLVPSVWMHQRARKLGY